MLLRPNQLPWPILARKCAADDIRAVMALNPKRQIVRMTDVKTASGILENVGPEHGKLAPEVGLEPTTHRLIPTRRDFSH